MSDIKARLAQAKREATLAKAQAAFDGAAKDLGAITFAELVDGDHNVRYADLIPVIVRAEAGDPIYTFGHIATPEVNDQVGAYAVRLFGFDYIDPTNTDKYLFATDSLHYDSSSIFALRAMAVVKSKRSGREPICSECGRHRRIVKGGKFEPNCLGKSCRAAATARAAAKRAASLGNVSAPNPVIESGIDPRIVAARDALDEHIASLAELDGFGDDDLIALTAGGSDPAAIRSEIEGLIAEAQAALAQVEMDVAAETVAA